MSTCKHSFTWTTNSTGPFNPPVNYLTLCPSCGTYGRWDGSRWVVQTESAGSLAMENAERFGDALGRIFAILGPSAPECEGCGAEIAAALEVIQSTMLMKEPRDPSRIDQILALLGEYWHRCPDLRLGQLVVNLIGPEPILYYVEDDAAEKELLRLLHEGDV